jgi:GDP-D-mannose 3',5'-epimerase
LVGFLVNRGYWVRAVDEKQLEYEPSEAHEFEVLDLRRWEDCIKATQGINEVYGLAANMGGIGFIESNKAVIVRDNTLMNLHCIEASRFNGVNRYLYTSSACIYPGYLQNQTNVIPLREEDAYPADADDGYGWEKLYKERVCATTSRTLGSRRGWCGFITFSVR